MEEALDPSSDRILNEGMLLQGKLYLGLTIGGAETNPDSFHNLRKIKKTKRKDMKNSDMLECEYE